MMKSFRLKPISAVFATALAATAMAGCGEDGLPSNPGSDLCCTEFTVGADLKGVDFGVDADLKGEFSAFAQGAADLSAVATASLDDVLISCQNLALDMGADASDPSVQGKSGKAAVSAWCALAVARINATFSAEVKAEGSLVIDYQPPVCSASFEAKANCQGGCTAEGSCDLKANPPMCTGGKLSVECSGSCSGEANAAVSCTGSCDAVCKGSCTAQAGATVDCQGKCDGTCTAGGMAGGSGIQADGTCNGQCDGTCEMAADAEVECSGTCNGSCEGSCTAQAGVKFTCDGTCEGDFEAPKCEGGKLEGGCEVSADCEASCNASASAKAECRPPSVDVRFELNASGSLDADASAQIAIAIESLKVNLPNLLVVFQARGEAFAAGIKGVVDAGVSISGNTGSLGVKGAACALAIVGVIGEASANFKASLDASASVAGSLDLG